MNIHRFQKVSAMCLDGILLVDNLSSLNWISVHRPVPNHPSLAELNCWVIQRKKSHCTAISPRYTEKRDCRDAICNRIVTLNFRPAADPKSPPDGLYPLLDGQPGFEGGWWGKWEEDANKVQVFIRKLSYTKYHQEAEFSTDTTDVEWYKVSSHTEFGKTAEAQKAMGGLLGPILGAAPVMHHVLLSLSLRRHRWRRSWPRR